MEAWSSFFIAEVGATAALIGLLFVALSINLQKITLYKQLTNKALGTFLLLLSVFIISSLSLIPNQSATLFGEEILFIGFLSWVTLIFVQAKTFHKKYLRHYIINFVLNQLATLPALIGGVLLYLNNNQGYYWLAPGILISILIVATNSWVLLVEINRQNN